MELFEAYADLAPLWERTLLAAYVGIGPPVARIFGGNTKAVWQQAESILEDIFAVTKMTPRQIVLALRNYVKVKRETDHHLSFDEACRQIYEQSFYPLVTHFTFAFQSSAIARMRYVKRVAETLPLQEARVADLGCGSGAMLCEVLRLKPRWTGYGLDVSDASLDYAQKLAIHTGVAGRANFQRGNICSLPFRSRSVDLVIASEVLEHLPEPRAALAEISRVLVPGGFLALTVPIESHTPAHLTLLNDADELRGLCLETGLMVQSVTSKWHLTFGDDRRHLFGVAQLKSTIEASERVYSLPLPQMSSAASSGIVSS